MITATVREFHSKHGFAVNTQMPVEEMEFENSVNRESFTACIENMQHVSRTMLLEYSYSSDMRALRMHLILEECAETMIAMASGNEIGTLDGLSDLLYVTAGTAVAFGLPLDEAFLEVHRSNMTKATAREREIEPQADPRLRNKGPNYRAPRLVEIYNFVKGWFK